MSEQYCKFLGIKPEYLYEGYFKEDLYGPVAGEIRMLSAGDLRNFSSLVGAPIKVVRVTNVVKVYPNLNKPENYTQLLDLYLALSGSVEIGLWVAEDEENYFLKINTDNKKPRGEKLFLGVTMVDCLMESLQYYEDKYKSIKDASRSLAQDIAWEYPDTVGFYARQKYLKGE